MVHSNILISGSKTIIYGIKERSVQAAKRSDLHILPVYAFFLIDVTVHTTWRM